MNKNSRSLQPMSQRLGAILFALIVPFLASCFSIPVRGEEATATNMLLNEDLPISHLMHQELEKKIDAQGSQTVTSSNQQTIQAETVDKIDAQGSQTVTSSNQQTIQAETVDKTNAQGLEALNTQDDQLALQVTPSEPIERDTLAGVGPIIIDNDEAEETEATIEYKDLPTDDGKTRVKAGAQFPVVISSEITSKSAKKGDLILARLKYDLKIGDRLIAKRGCQVNGHVNYVLKARTPLHTLVSPERWYRTSGVVGIAFDDIVADNGEHLPLVAQPARKSRIVKNKGEGRVLGVNHKGQVTGPWSQQLRYKALRIGLNAALAPAGVFSFGAMPVALGVIGAVNPSFAFMKPVGLNVRHRRLKGFAWGFLSGFPGSWLIEDTVVKGQEAVIKPGDEFLVEFREEFTGEPATDAMLIPGASTKVRGQVLTDPKTTKEHKKR